MPYQNTNQQLQAALMQQMQQPTSHKYGGVGKAALAAAMAIRGKREQEAAKEKRLAQAGILQSLLPFNNAPTDGVEGPPDPGAQAGQFNFQHMDAQTFANAMDNPIVANLFAQQVGLGKAPADSQKTGAYVVKRDGKNMLAVGVFNPQTKTFETQYSNLDGSLVSDLGETGEQMTARKIAEAAGKTRATGAEQRDSKLIAAGVAAAESTAVLRRSLALLDFVETGGLEAGALRIKQAFGVEGANEGELSANLGRAVVSQLRETFGSQFTEREGERLERISSRFGANTETNKRLLNQALTMAERKANRARELAQSKGQKATVKDIDDLLTFTIDFEEPQTQSEGSNVGRFQVQEVQ